MNPRERAESYARAFPKYPPPRYDSRWLDGFWVTGQNYQGSGFHGSYPPNYLKRLRALFPEEFEGRVLHLFSGSLDPNVGGIRIDLNLERNPPPDAFGDAHQLPFTNGTFDLIVADPPYTPVDAAKYGTPMINRRAVLAECARVLKPGGHLIWLDTRKPMFKKSIWTWWGIIGICTSTNHVYRAVTFYQRREENIMSKLSAKITAASEKIAAALAILLGEDEATVSEAVKAQKSNTKLRETGDDDDEPVAPKKRGRPAGSPNKKKVEVEDEDDDADEKPAKGKLKAPVTDEDDDEDEDEDDDDAAEGASVPKDKALEEMDRAALKALAVKLDIDAAGKNREDLIKLLQEARDGKPGKSKKAAKVADDDDEDEDEKPAKKTKAAVADDDDDEDEDEAPAKKKKAAAADDDEDDKPNESDYPKVSLMKKHLEAFIKVNKQTLKDMGFFGGKVKKGAQKLPNTYDEVMADVDLIKETWADNVFPLGTKGITKLLAEAEEIEDEDDDE